MENSHANRSWPSERLNNARQLPISIIVVDLNGLKLVNETYAHAKRDEMLKTVSGIIKKSCREEDVISRLGGEEFVILLLQTTVKEAELICRIIQSNCKET